MVQPDRWMGAFRRIGLSFGLLTLSIALFSLFFSLRFHVSLSSSPILFSSSSFLLVFNLTLKAAFPIWLLCLPFVVALKDAEEWRFWTILAIGTLIKPIYLAFEGFILQLQGEDMVTIWRGDRIGPGIEQRMMFAFFIGLLTTSFYVIILRHVRRRSRSV